MTRLRAANQRLRSEPRVLSVSAQGSIRSASRDALTSLLRPGDLLVANDAATLPASLQGTHDRTQSKIEVRLARWIREFDPRRFTAVVFGEGDHRTPTEERRPAPEFRSGDRLSLGPLVATVIATTNHPRLVELRLHGSVPTIWAGLARHGRPIQYAHVPQRLDLWDTWTSLAAKPLAFEAPSASYVFDGSMAHEFIERGIRLATLTHSAGISSTGDASLDAHLPFDEPFQISEKTAADIRRTKFEGGRVIAAGTTVVRALETAARRDGTVVPGRGIARGRIDACTTLQVVDAILTGLHEPGESHFELLKAFASSDRLRTALRQAADESYLAHEYGDAMLLEREVPFQATDCEGTRGMDQ